MFGKPAMAWLRINDIWRQGKVMDGGVGGGSYSVTDGGVEPDDPELKRYGRWIIYFMLLVTLAIVVWQKIYDWFNK